MATAMHGCRICVRGIVQGVGFRPFVFGLAQRYGLAGWVMNSTRGVEISLEGSAAAIDVFVAELRARPPAAARVADIAVESAAPQGQSGFHIRESARLGEPATQLSPDLSVCADCLRELFDPADRRYLYPYINCTNCGPRFSISTALPYDRESTTMAEWTMCGECDREYHDPADRRFHAQPIACPRCGPRYRLVEGGTGGSRDHEAIARAARLLADGRVVAIKGIGGYHLACDARNAAAVIGLRERKYRKAQAFAVMVQDIDLARELVDLTDGAEGMLASVGRPIVLSVPRVVLPGVSPEHPDVGVMLPYAPLHYLLFAAGAPRALVMTSGNRSNEPIAFDDDDALQRLHEIADAFLVGERPIARRVDDSVVQMTPFDPVITRRSRGFAPAAVARFETGETILAVGGDLKNTIALVARGDALVSQHIGDLEDYGTRRAFERTIHDVLALYDVDLPRLFVAHDAHPQYASTCHALGIPARRHLAVQHHRAHVASVLAERNALDARVIGLAFDGTGFGDDGTIWGGEFFVGSVAAGFDRVAHLRPALLPGGDAAAAFPAQAAAGFVAELGDVADLTAEPFRLPARYHRARQLIERGVRTFTTTSAGRLFDAAAALVGFAGPSTFEAQAALWLEYQASSAAGSALVPFEFDGQQLDWRPAVRAIIRLRLAGVPASAIAHGFHSGFAQAIADAALGLCVRHDVDTVVLSGGVFQNALLLRLVQRRLADHPITVWTNRAVPPGDGGLALGQAAIAASTIAFGR
jgi:hydrogenase maturation protein HypF